MRNFFSLVLIGSLAVFLAGCGDPGTDMTVDEPASVTVRGTLQSLGNVHFSAKATHLLRREEGGILYVYSPMYNLNNPDYLNHSVEVQGPLYLPDETSTKETLKIEALRVLQTDELANRPVVRGTYVHPSLGFQWTVRSDWAIDETSNRVMFTAPESAAAPEGANRADETGTESLAPILPLTRDTIEVRRLSNPESLPIEEWYLEYVLTEGVVSPYTNSAVGPEALPAIRADIKDAAGNTVLYYVADGDRVFIISHHSVQPEFRLEYGNLFSDMLFSFDSLRDGVRPEAIESEKEASEDASTPPPLSVDSTKSANDAPAIDAPAIDAISPQAATFYSNMLAALQQTSLSSLIPQSGFWTAVRYDFVEPDYVYVVYENPSGVQGRVLLRHAGGASFDRVAAFDEGTSTDWALTSGSDETRGKSVTSLHVGSGAVTTIPEGYRSMESASLDFSMHYPARWYYGRSGDFFYFSDEPAEASNALVTLELMSTPVAAYREDPGSSPRTVWVPRDASSSFRLQASSEFLETLRVMAKSIVTTRP